MSSSSPSTLRHRSASKTTTTITTSKENNNNNNNSNDSSSPSTEKSPPLATTAVATTTTTPSKYDKGDTKKIFPYGQSLFPIIWERDPTHFVLKAFFVIITTVGLIFLCVLPWIVVNVFGADGDWDAKHGIVIVGGVGITEILLLLEETMALSPRMVYNACAITLIVVGASVCVDVMGGVVCGWSEVWPRSWNTRNIQCYDEMFSEPTRMGRFLRRPGNTLSNMSFLFGSICILFSVANTMMMMMGEDGGGEEQQQQQQQHKENLFVVADGMFGIMLFLLGVFSFIWHGCNAPWSHYPDLWTMESCIFYLIVRYCCLAEYALMKQYLSDFIDVDTTARVVASRSCSGLYALIVYGLGYTWYQRYNIKMLHGGCPISGRARLLKKSNVMGKGHVDCWVSTICAYQSLPVVYLAIPTLIEVFVLRSAGSVLAGYITCVSLSVGWGYRILDRWTVDGCVPMNFFAGLENGVWRTFGSALFSPTAVLHFFTGITLLAGYVHSRSAEDAL